MISSTKPRDAAMYGFANFSRNSSTFSARAPTGSAAFSISRLRVPGGRWVMNLALLTYFIPAAFLAVPMYRTMGTYGLLNNHWSLILAMVTIASLSASSSTP